MFAASLLLLSSLTVLLLLLLSWPSTSCFASAFQIKASVSVSETAKDNSAHSHNIINKIEKLVQEKLNRIVAGYQTHGDKMKRTLDVELELCSKIEMCFMGGNVCDRYRNLLLSTKLRTKQRLLEECLSANDHVVRQLLATAHGVESDEQKLFHEINFVPSASVESTGEYDDLGRLMGNGGLMEGGETKKETDGYDTALQVIHHTTRDWTVGAAPCREETTGWIVRAIIEYSSHYDSSHYDECDGLRVLVPGAGLGRLAYEISTCKDLVDMGVVPYVEANDSSVTMVFAAHNILKILQRQQEEGQRSQFKSTIFPFLSDSQVNEIDARKRFEMEAFPDESAIKSYNCYFDLSGTHPKLSFTIGDFVSTYSQQAKQNQYHAVATSFFIDTATNIYEYIFIMKHILSDNGIWVNCGPVQWHPCALLRPTVEQLKDMLQVAGFELLSWSIVNQAVAYRHPDDMGGKGLEARYTRSEAYRPLRFVARLKAGDDNQSEDFHLRVQYSEYLHEVVNGKSL